ncbi:unnamed protein product [Pneumocystis jirovecii]|uniref:Uncharacterized protein n=1 Tax=Pneumocystis jirovecii TaxID=42068 RepID=L0PAN6_PNEJI|nr:unnamed protein product [Pneumocystis jirovecii]
MEFPKNYINLDYILKKNNLNNNVSRVNVNIAVTVFEIFNFGACQIDAAISSISIFIPIYEEVGPYTSSINVLTLYTSFIYVFSTRPFTTRADRVSSSATSLHVTIGTPNVTFIDATPAKWKVFKVI